MKKNKLYIKEFFNTINTSNILHGVSGVDLLITEQYPLYRNTIFNHLIPAAYLGQWGLPRSKSENTRTIEIQGDNTRIRNVSTIGGYNYLFTDLLESLLTTSIKTDPPGYNVNPERLNCLIQIEKILFTARSALNKQHISCSYNYIYVSNSTKWNSSLNFPDLDKVHPSLASATNKCFLDLFKFRMQFRFYIAALKYRQWLFDYLSNNSKIHLVCYLLTNALTNYAAYEFLLHRTVIFILYKVLLARYTKFHISKCKDADMTYIHTRLYKLAQKCFNLVKLDKLFVSSIIINFLMRFEDLAKTNLNSDAECSDIISTIISIHFALTIENSDKYKNHGIVMVHDSSRYIPTFLSPVRYVDKTLQYFAYNPQTLILLIEEDASATLTNGLLTNMPSISTNQKVIDYFFNKYLDYTKEYSYDNIINHPS